MEVIDFPWNLSTKSGLPNIMVIVVWRSKFSFLPLLHWCVFKLQILLRGQQCPLLQCHVAHARENWFRCSSQPWSLPKMLIWMRPLLWMKNQSTLWQKRWTLCILLYGSCKNKFNRLLNVHETLLQLIELKRRSVHLKWDFTFNLRLKQYPGDTEDWFQSERWLCSTLRLFFPVWLIKQS